MSAQIREIIVYRVQANLLGEFEAVKKQMITESLTLEGLLSSNTAQVLDEEGVFVDTMVWSSREASTTALPIFEQLPTAPRFLGMSDGPPLHHLFLEYQPDQPLSAAA